MYSFKDQHGNIIAYYSDKAIIDANSLKVSGVILGNFVFDSHSNLVGNFYHNQIRNNSGEILAEMHEENINPAQPESSFVLQAWELVMKIKNHSIGLLLPVSNQWAVKNLDHYLSNN